VRRLSVRRELTDSYHSSRAYRVAGSRRGAIRRRGGGEKEERGRETLGVTAGDAAAADTRKARKNMETQITKGECLPGKKKEGRHGKKWRLERARWGKMGKERRRQGRQTWKSENEGPRDIYDGASCTEHGT